MSTRRMNVSISVGEVLFDEIVYPAKDDKRLGKLVTSLLESYRTDEYVRALIDGDLDEHNANLNSELGDILKGMNENINEADFHLQSAEATASSGSSDFANGAPNKVYSEGSEGQSDVSRLDRLETTVDKLMGSVDKLVEGFANGNIKADTSSTNGPEEDTVEENLGEAVVEPMNEVDEDLSSDPVELDDSIFDDYESSDDFDDEDEEDNEPAPAATDLLARLSKNVNKGGL